MVLRIAAWGLSTIVALVLIATPALAQAGSGASQGWTLLAGGSDYSGSGPGQFGFVRGLAVDKSGNVYVSDGGNGRVQKLSPAGAPLA
jgi:hypothetical protein